MFSFDSNKKAHLLMVTWSILIASSFPAASLIVGKIDTTSITALRFIISSCLFFIFISISFKFKIKLPKIKDFICYSTLSACLVFYFWSLFKALETTTPLHTGILFTSVPLFTALISNQIFKVKISKHIKTALLLGAVGAIWAVLKGDIELLSAFSFNSGDQTFIYGCITFAFYGPFVNFAKKKGMLTASSAVITFWIMLIGSIALIAIALIEQKGELQWGILNYQDYLTLLYLSIFTTIITFWQIQYCTQILDATIVMSYSYLIPSMVLLIDIVIYGNAAPPSVFLGIMFTFIALILINHEFKITRSFSHSK